MKSPLNGKKAQLPMYSPSGDGLARLKFDPTESPLKRIIALGDFLYPIKTFY